MEHITYLLVAMATVSFTVVCLNWPHDKRA
jgi:hypothetical protein